jgi:hypothetical protein
VVTAVPYVFILLAGGRIEVADHTTDVVRLGTALPAIESLRAARTMKVLIDPRG